MASDRRCPGNVVRGVGIARQRIRSGVVRAVARNPIEPEAHAPTEAGVVFARMLRLRVGNVARVSVAPAAIGSYPVIGKSVSAFMSVKLVTAWLGGGGVVLDVSL